MKGVKELASPMMHEEPPKFVFAVSRLTLINSGSVTSSKLDHQLVTLPVLVKPVQT